MQMTSLGLPDFRSGVVTSLRGSPDFLSRCPEGGGPLEDTTGNTGTDQSDSHKHLPSDTLHVDHI